MRLISILAVTALCVTRAVAAACTSEERSRSYPVPQSFIFPPFRAVLERTRGSCDHIIASQRSVDAATRQAACSNFSAGMLGQPEPFVTQAIASFLYHCQSRSGKNRCHAADFGGNLGLVTAHMVALGAEVVTVEPDRELARAISETVAANCWSASLVTVHNKLITANPADDGSMGVFRGGWRMDDPSIRRPRSSMVNIISIQRILGARRHWDFIKIDIDNHAVESALLVEIERRVTAGELTLDALVIEVRRDPSRGGMAAALSRFQLEHGYTIFRLAHLLQSTGHLEPWYAECYALRALRYALRVRPLTHSGWARALALTADAATGRRSESTSLLISRTPIGSAVEAQWHSAADSFNTSSGLGKVLGSCYHGAASERASDYGDAGSPHGAKKHAVRHGQAALFKAHTGTQWKPAKSDQRERSSAPQSSSSWWQWG